MADRLISVIRSYCSHEALNSEQRCTLDSWNTSKILAFNEKTKLWREACPEFLIAKDLPKRWAQADAYAWIRDWLRVRERPWEDLGSLIKSFSIEQVLFGNDGRRDNDAWCKIVPIGWRALLGPDFSRDFSSIPSYLISLRHEFFKMVSRRMAHLAANQDRLCTLADVAFLSLGIVASANHIASWEQICIWINQLKWENLPQEELGDAALLLLGALNEAPLLNGTPPATQYKAVLDYLDRVQGLIVRLGFMALGGLLSRYKASLEKYEHCLKKADKDGTKKQKRQFRIENLRHHNLLGMTESARRVPRNLSELSIEFAIPLFTIMGGGDSSIRPTAVFPYRHESVFFPRAGRERDKYRLGQMKQGVELHEDDPLWSERHELTPLARLCHIAAFGRHLIGISDAIRNLTGSNPPDGDDPSFYARCQRFMLIEAIQFLQDEIAHIEAMAMHPKAITLYKEVMHTMLRIRREGDPPLQLDVQMQDDSRSAFLATKDFLEKILALLSRFEGDSKASTAIKLFKDVIEAVQKDEKKLKWPVPQNLLTELRDLLAGKMMNTGETEPTVQVKLKKQCNQILQQVQVLPKVMNASRPAPVLPNIYTEENTWQGRPYDMPLVTLNSRNCRWLLSGGGCTTCNYNQVASAGQEKIPHEYLMQQVHYAMKVLPADQYPFWTFSSAGSFFDDQEVPHPTRLEILRVLSIAGYKALNFESRPQFCRDVNRLREVRSAFSGEVSVGLGLESYSDVVRYVCLNKGYPTRVFEESARALTAAGFPFDCYVLLGKPLLGTELTDGGAFTDWGAHIVEAELTIRYALNKGAEYCILMVANLQPNTLSYALFRQDLYELPSLWTAVEVLRRLGPELNCRVLLKGLMRAMPHPLVHATTCPNCVGEFRRAHIAFNQGKSLEDTFNALGKCACRDEFLKRIEASPALKEGGISPEALEGLIAQQLVRNVGPILKIFHASKE